MLLSSVVSPSPFPCIAPVFRWISGGTWDRDTRWNGYTSCELCLVVCLFFVWILRVPVSRVLASGYGICELLLVVTVASMMYIIGRSKLINIRKCFQLQQIGHTCVCKHHDAHFRSRQRCLFSLRADEDTRDRQYEALLSLCRKAGALKENQNTVQQLFCFKQSWM
ncbi:hypothetical protein V8F33_011403 [Rhypophila sp. PSN 637]